MTAPSVSAERTEDVSRILSGMLDREIGIAPVEKIDILDGDGVSFTSAWETED